MRNVQRHLACGPVLSLWPCFLLPLAVIRIHFTPPPPPFTGGPRRGRGARLGRRRVDSSGAESRQRPHLTAHGPGHWPAHGACAVPPSDELHALALGTDPVPVMSCRNASLPICREGGSYLLLLLLLKPKPAAPLSDTVSPLPADRWSQHRSLPCPPEMALRMLHGTRSVSSHTTQSGRHLMPSRRRCGNKCGYIYSGGGWYPVCSPALCLTATLALPHSSCTSCCA